jgi:ribosomal protein L37AE/L43A
MTPHFRKVSAAVSQKYVCEHCHQPITLMRSGVWRSQLAGTLCLKSASKRHEPNEVPSA